MEQVDDYESILFIIKNAVSQQLENFNQNVLLMVGGEM